MSSLLQTKYYKVEITKQSKSFNPKDGYQTFDKEIILFDTIKQIKEELKKLYPKHKRTKMYIDYKEKTYQIGFIIGFINWTYEDGKRYKYLERHLIEISHITETIPPFPLKEMTL